MNKRTISSEELAALCVQIAEDRKAEDVVSLKIGDVSVVADYFVICGGNSSPHVRAIAEKIRRDVREKHNVRPSGVEGDAESQWVILDFGDVVVHVLGREARTRYQLEELWGDAPRVAMALAAKTRERKAK